MVVVRLSHESTCVPKPVVLLAEIHRALCALRAMYLFVGETRKALSEEAYVFPRAVGYNSCEVPFWSWSAEHSKHETLLYFNTPYGGNIMFPRTKPVSSPQQICEVAVWACLLGIS